MNQIATMLTPPLKLLIGYAHGLVKDIDDKVFASKPSSKTSEIVNLNHPAFLMGHLGVYPEKILDLLGEDSSGVVAPEGFKELFLKGIACEHDPDRNIYPSKDVILANFNSGYEIIVEALSRASTARFDETNPYEDAIERFPTIGAFVSFLVSGHMAMHLGQISSWRRIMGMGPV